MPGDEPRWRQTARRVPPINRALRRLRRSDEIVALQQELAHQRDELAHQRDELAHQRDEHSVAGVAVDAGVVPFLTWRPPGHYYSPVPDLGEIRRQADRIYVRRPGPLTGLDLHEEEQLALFTTLAPLAKDVTFNADPGPDRRYFTNNPAYGVGDAVITQAILRHLRPARYLEVGSGWTTALALDTSDQWLGSGLRVTCIEPYPHDLLNLLRPTDDVEVIASPVQDVDVARFGELEPNDVLFIDCSHVVKTGSDAHHLVTRVLPAVPVGVYIHIHDIFWPFEYPEVWIEEGRAWSEAYLLHAFLLYNDAFRVVLFNDWLTQWHRERIAGAVPALAPGAGGAIWLRREH